MTDVHTPAQRSFNMSRIRSRDTTPEMRVRRILHAAGLRYRLHDKRLPGKPDLVFRAARAVIFVHGCFWHMHRCKYGKPAPATNADFWAKKRLSNVDRDRRNKAALRKAGWKVIEIWECATHDSARLGRALSTVIETLRERSAQLENSR